MQHSGLGEAPAKKEVGRPENSQRRREGFTHKPSKALRVSAAIDSPTYLQNSASAAERSTHKSSGKLKNLPATQSKGNAQQSPATRGKGWVNADIRRGWGVEKRLRH